MFNISDFYYYSPNGDITNCIQRQSLPTYNRDEPLWKRADERFFWNKSLMEDLINSNVSFLLAGLIIGVPHRKTWGKGLGQTTQKGKCTDYVKFKSRL